MDKRLFALGCLLAALAVGLGAFGAHGLAAHLDARGMDLYRTAVQYLMLHSVGVMFAGWVGGRIAQSAGVLFCLGSVLFCGSLIALALQAPRWLGAIAPLGGGSFLLGWLVLGYSAMRTNR
ncbi:MAG: DUF423 domain-containing protein [Fimbriimonadales bacterium]